MILINAFCSPLGGLVSVGMHVAHGVVAVDLRGVHRVLFVKVDFKCLEKLLQFSAAFPCGVPLTNVCDGMSVEICCV